MKKKTKELWMMATLLMGVLLLVRSAISEERWQVISYVEGAHFHDISFADEQHGWAIDRDGSVFFTTDGGTTWHCQSHGHWLFYEAIQFIDVEHGWIVGRNLVLRTEDGGKTWQKSEVNGWLLSVHFVNKKEGWAVGVDLFQWNKGKLFHTKDGGKTWVAPLGTIEGALYDVYFPTPKNGWIVGMVEERKESIILHTSDSGQTWKRQRIDLIDVETIRVYFLNEKEGWIVGRKGTILHTEDGGKKWNLQVTGKERDRSLTLTDLRFINQREGVLVGYCSARGKKNIEVSRGVILITSDGGRNWKKIETDVRLSAIDFPTKKKGWIAGDYNTILHTDDGGKSFSPQTERAYSYNDVYFLSPQNGWIVASWFHWGFGDFTDSHILHTTDSGKKWTDISKIKSCWLYGVDFLNTQDGFVAGEFLLGTHNGGKSWAQIEEVGHFWDVYFVNQKNGWAIGRDDSIVTKDGGSTWTHTHTSLSSVFFLSEREGFAIRGRTILHTQDGGFNWKISYRGGVPLNAIYFVNRMHGWAVGWGGIILHTDNGGKRWTIQNAGIGEILFDVLFLSEEEGWAVGKKGTILHTQDGGKNWERQKSGVETTLLRISYTRGTRLIVVGEWNTILAYHDKRFEKYAQAFSIQPKGKILFTWGGIKNCLYQNYPNPFNPETWIPFSIAKQASISIQIHNLKGQLVRTINLGDKEPGLYLSKEKAAHWDGRNQAGEPVSSGIYYYSIFADDFSETRKMILIK